MKVKILTSFPKKTINVDGVFFSSDFHIDHQAVIDFGRNFKTLSDMNISIIDSINKKVSRNSLLVLLGDTMMGEKNYADFLNKILCENVIILFGNHCNIGKLTAVKDSQQFDKLLYIGYYLELNIESQIVCCQHYPSFNWNYQEDGAISLHGHLHADESTVVKEIHKYKSMDVGVDSYYKLFEEYNIFSFEQIQEVLKDKLTVGRH